MCEKLLTTIPFGGFYETCWSQAIDDEEENYAEFFANEMQEEIADYLRLSESEVAEILFRATDYKIAYNRFAKAYADAYDKWISDALGWNVGLKFESLDSPREYNFYTDRIFCYIPLESVKRLFDISAKEDHKRLKEVIRERFTSRDGFISFYSNNLEEWVNKPIYQWDHNEIGTLLIAIAPPFDDASWEFYEDMAYNGGFYQDWEAAVNWKEFERLVEERRQEKLSDCHV